MSADVRIIQNIPSREGYHYIFFIVQLGVPAKDHRVQTQLGSLDRLHERGVTVS